MMCLGVSVVFASGTFVLISDISFNWLGAVYALGGVFAASLYQIWTGTLQKNLNVTWLNLLYRQALISSIILLLMFPFIDDIKALYEFQMDFICLSTLLMSSAFSVLVYISTSILFKETGDIATIFGHFLIITAGFLVFGYPVTVLSTAGLLITILGICWYSWLKL